MSFHADKKLIIFDLDGTLTESKTPMEDGMSQLLSTLLYKKKVAIMSGGSFKQFENQFLRNLRCPASSMENLFLFPTCATTFYRHTGAWTNVYRENLSEADEEKIMRALARSLQESNFAPQNTYGEPIENRGTQITFSALGQDAPLHLKKAWDPLGAKRLKIAEKLRRYIPEFEIRIGGATSIDVTRKGIDKGYGIAQIEKYLGVVRAEMLFFGDALFPGGNDYPVLLCGVECIKVSNPQDTKRYISLLL